MRILTSLFQAIAPRTAGFNTVDFQALSGASKGMMIGLMLIGGSPGSAAGGMKTPSFVFLLANVIAGFKKKEDAELFGRRINTSAVRTAGAIFMMYLALFLISGIAACRSRAGSTVSRNGDPDEAVVFSHE